MSRVTPTGVESGILKSWDGWDGDLESMQFYNPEFNQTIGKFEADKVYEDACVFFHLDTATLQIYDGEHRDNLAFEGKIKIVLEK